MYSKYDIKESPFRDMVHLMENNPELSDEELRETDFWKDSMNKWVEQVCDLQDIAEKNKVIADKLLAESSVSDKVELTKTEYGTAELSGLVELFLGDELEQLKDTYSLPSDLFFSKTVSIKDLEVEDNVNKFRVVIRDDYAEEIDKLDEENDSLVVGVLEYTIKAPKDSMVGFINPDDVDRNGKCNIYCKLCLIVHYGSDEVELSIADKSLSTRLTMDKNPFGKISFNSLLFWYCIQLSLLHPETKDVFSHPKEIKFAVKSKNNKSRKRKTKYVRKHIIKDDKIVKLEKQSREINCLCWYVIGHWRHYKSGKKVFVQGFWKGALRDTKRNQDGGRERKIL